MHSVALSFQNFTAQTPTCLVAGLTGITYQNIRATKSKGIPIQMAVRLAHMMGTNLTLHLLLTSLSFLIFTQNRQISNLQVTSTGSKTMTERKMLNKIVLQILWLSRCRIESNKCRSQSGRSFILFRQVPAQIKPWCRFSRAASEYDWTLFYAIQLHLHCVQRVGSE